MTEFSRIPRKLYEQKLEENYIHVIQGRKGERVNAFQSNVLNFLKLKI
jgi:hypothetical protein